MSQKTSFLMLCLCGLFAASNQSIAGVTYKDNFDFEERYAHDECNPLNWHPLHMPDHCIKIYEKLIRKELNNTHPYNFKGDEQSYVQLYDKFMKFHHSRAASSSNESHEHNKHKTKHQKNRKKRPKKRERERRKKTLCLSEESNSDPSGESDCVRDKEDMDDNVSSKNEIELIPQNFQPEIALQLDSVINNPWIPPHMQMMNLVKLDVMTLPAQPIIGFLPNIGYATVYRQPVSKKTEDMIKKVSGNYAVSAQKTYEKMAEAFQFPLYPEGTPQFDELRPRNETDDMNSPNNGDGKKNMENKIKLQVNKMAESFKNKQKLKSKPGNKYNPVQVKKIVNGNSVTYIQKSKYDGR